MTSFTVDTRNMAKLAADLQGAAVTVEPVVPISLREGAAVVATEARGLSSWSSRIPGSIRVAGAGNTVVVSAGGPNAPHAPVFEHGGHPGVFHHPTYGHAPWVAQNARPFLAPALITGSPALDRAGEHNVDVVLRRVNL